MVLLVISCTVPGCLTERWSTSTVEMRGESLVLASTLPGKLCFDDLVKKSITIRSTYLADHPNSIVYREGADYTVDYTNGGISRTMDSQIPDYSKHPLYRKKDFDHTQYPNYSNLPYFVWVDYKTKNGESLAQPTDQSDYLRGFRKKLDKGTSATIVSYGNSITAGGEASSMELMFQFRYADYLRNNFPKANISMEDVSIPGHTSTHGIDLWDAYIGKTSPDLVLVGWGMNDHNINANSPDQLRENLVKLVGMIKEKKHAEVILFSTFPPHDEWQYGTHRMELYSEATRMAAKQAHCAFVNVYQTWKKVLQRKDQSSLLANNINHPNDFGHWLYLQSFMAMRF